MQRRLQLQSIFIALLLAVLCPSSSSAQQPKPVLAIEHVTLIDGTGRPPVPDATVIVEGDRIAHVQSSGGTAVPSGARRIDGHGKFLLPGLMDIHIHLRGGRGKTPDESAGIRALQGYLYSGVTTILDVGNNPDFIFSLRDKERAGQILAPHVLAVGGIVTYPGSHGAFPGMATLVDSWPQSKPALDALFARHPDMLKMTYEEEGWGTRPMISLLPLDLMQHIIAYANDHGIRTTVHVSSEIRARETLSVGVDTLAHTDIQGPITPAFARTLAARQTPTTSTMTIGDNYSRLADHPEFLDQPLYRAVLPADEIQRLKTEESAKQKQNRWAAWMKLMTPVLQENLRQIDAAGGIVACGTDQSSGPAVHRELELLAGAGIKPLEVIRIATLNSARFLGRDRDVGSVEEGKIADLVLLNADPLQDINNTKQINTVIKAGQMIDRAKLDLLPVNQRASGAGK